MDITYLDLFAGTGGFAKGFLEAGFRFKKHYFSEVDKHAIANYHYNYPLAEYVGQVEEIRKGKIDKPSLITFGSPCQDLSTAGKRQGLRKGTRSSLFFEALRIIDEFQPDYFVFENVKGLFSSQEGRDFKAVLQAFADLGVYDLQWQLVDTKWLLPQSRERVYVVGHHREQSAPQVFPINQAYQKVAPK